MNDILNDYIVKKFVGNYNYYIRSKNKFENRKPENCLPELNITKILEEVNSKVNTPQYAVVVKKANAAWNKYSDDLMDTVYPELRELLGIKVDE